MRSAARRPDERLALVPSLPFFAVHLVAALAAILVRPRPVDLALCAGLYLLRMFALTAGYHRYFAHRSFRTSRLFQFVLAFLGATATQKGPLWWAAHHRRHHLYSDTEDDVHSPTRRGLWWAHVGWILCHRWMETDLPRIRDFARFGELRWLNRWHLVAPVALAVLLFAGAGWGGLLWGYFVSTVLLWHGTFTINSLMHLFGRRRYATTDTSRNSLLLALVTLGEGWHNNHHYYQRATRQGFYWWEIDLTFYVLCVLSWLGVVWGLHGPPHEVREGGRIEAGAALSRS